MLIFHLYYYTYIADISAYEIVNIDVEITKIVIKMQIMNRITKNLRDKNFGQNLANFDLCPFYKNVIYSKSHFVI